MIRSALLSAVVKQGFLFLKTGALYVLFAFTVKLFFFSLKVKAAYMQLHPCDTDLENTSLLMFILN